MTTFADMTPQEWPQCVGMWCEHHGRVAVIAGFSRDSHIPDEWPDQWDVEVVEPGQFSQREGSPSGYIPVSADITLRFDLPRAWNPDGTPPAGHWDYGEQLGYTVAPAEGPECANLRCWVSDWEPVE